MGNISAVQEYLKATGGLDIEEKDAKGITCLGYAVGANRIAIVKMLLDAKADPYHCDSSGGTALHYAGAYGRKELTEFLIKAGHPVNPANTLGKTPLALATQNKMKETIELLKTKGAAVDGKLTKGESRTVARGIITSTKGMGTAAQKQLNE